MKIDFDALDKLAESGATAQVIIAYLRLQDTKREPKRARDRKSKQGRKQAKRSDRTPNASETERNGATLEDTPRARLFREGTPVLMALGRTEPSARALIAQCCKLTHDDDQLVTATILRAGTLTCADPVGWILATLKGKTNGSRSRRQDVHEVAGDLIARAEALERDAGAGEPEPFTIEGTRNG